MWMESEQMPERKELLVHSVQKEENIEAEIVSAFLELGIDVSGRDDVLYDMIDPDALSNLISETNAQTVVLTHLWNHPTLINNERICIYEKREDREDDGTPPSVGT